MTDKELYIAFLEGDKKAFETLVLSYRHQLIYFVMQYTKSYEMAEDIVQDVFAYFYIEPNSYDINYTFKTFLYTIAKRRAIDLIRKEERQPKEDIDNIVIEDIKSLEEVVFAREDIRDMKEALQEIKVEYAQVIILTQVDGMSMEEAAKILDRTLSSTKVLLHRARKALKQKMKKRGG